MRSILVTMLVLMAGLFSQSVAKSNPSAKALITRSIAAMGGKERLQQLHTLSLRGIGHNYLLEQSERPEGPWIVNYSQVEQVRDYQQQRMFLKKENKNTQQPEWVGTTMLYAEGTIALKLAGGEVVPGRRSMAEEAEDILSLAPEQVLLRAYIANDLQALRDTVLQGVPHEGVTFRDGDTNIRLYVNAYTHLPTLLQVTRAYPHDLMWSVWGNVRSDMFFSFWSLTPEGILYPLQYNMYRNNQPYQEFTVLSLRLNEDIPDGTFEIPDNVKKAFAAQPMQDFNALPLGRPDQQPKELAPGVLLIPGFWNVALVKQEDGVVLLEAPISEGYTAKALDEAKKLYPTLKVKGVITTSDAWPHVAGVREGASRNLPIYALDLNRPLLQRLLSAPHVTGPSKRRARLMAVSSKTVVGKGANRMELYPVRGESGERMMLVYFPEHKLLYASDLVQLNRDGSFFQKAYLAEVVAAVKRNGLLVEQVFAMHTGAIPYEKLLEATAQTTAHLLK